MRLIFVSVFLSLVWLQMLPSRQLLPALTLAYHDSMVQVAVAAAISEAGSSSRFQDAPCSLRSTNNVTKSYMHERNTVHQK
jgi:hypothetical protein